MTSRVAQVGYVTTWPRRGLKAPPTAGPNGRSPKHRAAHDGTDWVSTHRAPLAVRTRRNT